MKYAGRAPRPVLGLLVACAATLVGREAMPAPIRVAVIGPQHVHSHQLTRDKEFPAMLQVLLGPGYAVGNFGDCCATVLQGYPRQKETHPYLESGESYNELMNFKDSVKFMPEIVVVGPWGKHDTEIANQLYKGILDRAKFEQDYDTLITTYMNLPTKPRIYVSLPIPIPFGMPKGVTTTVMLPAIKAVAEKYQLPIVDLYSIFVNHPELFKDETHVTNGDGLHKIADAVYAVMKASDGDAGVPADAREDAGPANDAAPEAGAIRGFGGAEGSGAGGAGGSPGGGQGGATVARKDAAPPAPEPDAAPPTSKAEGRAGCTLVGAGTAPDAAPALLLALVALLVRRRRR